MALGVRFGKGGESAREIEPHGCRVVFAQRRPLPDLRQTDVNEPAAAPRPDVPNSVQPEPEVPNPSPTWRDERDAPCPAACCADLAR